MATCELCGKEGASFRVSLEGSVVSVCKLCSKHGKPVEMPRQQAQHSYRPRPAVPQVITSIVEDYASKIRNKRQELKLEQKDFANKIGVKESLLHKIENGLFEPDLDTARRVEKILHIKLTVQVEGEENERQKQKPSTALTIGDVIQFKSRKV